MKNLTFGFLTLLFSMAIVLNGCNKDDDPVSEITKLSATIDGAEWNSITSMAKNTNNILTISGVSVSGSSITITMYDGFDEGTYHLNKYSFGVAVYQEQTGGEGFTTNATSEAGGQVVITDIDYENKTISGTYQSDLIGQSSGNKVVVTDGVIDKLGYTSK